MSNQYFQFKQFKIEQDKCAMKVSTDACIQGAWTPIYESVKRVLDMGAGTGLLSLMLAQRAPQIYIDAVELDEHAAIQATENIAASPWTERINLAQADIKVYVAEEKYDLIICNPPFFKNSLLGDDSKRNVARHTIALSYEDLLNSCKARLATGGSASVLLPYSEYQYWQTLIAQHGWQETAQLMIRPRRDLAVNRVVSVIQQNGNSAIKTQELTIYEQAGVYTEAFKQLLAPFYLHL